jgi:hemoglobin
MKLPRVTSGPRIAALLAFCLLAGVATIATLQQTAWAEHHEGDDADVAPSLYDRLGGTYAIATVVDDFIDRVSANDTLNANPAIDAARKRVPPAGLKFQVTAFMIQATGGPYKYHGRNMVDSHTHLHITEAEWQTLAADFKATLDHFEVPEKEQGELFALVGTTHDDIVTAE